jgi:hypothetical protein
MLSKVAFANSLAVLTAALYILFVIIALVSPSAFHSFSTPSSSGPMWPRSSQRYGRPSVVTLVIVVVMAWIMGYVWAWLYNWFARIF